MKILATGSAGMLGSGLVPTLVDAGHDVVPTDIRLRPQAFGAGRPELSHLDVRSRDELADAFATVRPDYVCHLAAETSLEASEEDPEHAFLTNTVATKFVAFECEKHDIPMVYISTAGVFDGLKEDGPYHEWDDAHPINVYGRSKYEGEKIVEQRLSKYFIIRAGWMTGGGDLDHKFVARMLKQIRDGKKVLHAVGDKLGTPTYVPDFAKTFLGLLASESWGRYHMACEGEGSRYDVCAKILEVLGLRDEIELVEVDSGYFKDEFPAPRPRSEIMRNLHLELQGLNQMRPWPVALEEYLQVNFGGLIRQ